jgi:uncharacterized phage protein (TIGR01671 family)
MNRELKFRAYHKHRKEIYDVYGFNKHFVFKDILDGPGSDGVPDKIEDVDLLQFTGLLDKNGKEVYEEDILEHAYERLIVTYGIQEVDAFNVLGFNIYTMQGSEPGKRLSLEIEVIGNIYENPELLTEEL